MTFVYPELQQENPYIGPFADDDDSVTSVIYQTDVTDDNGQPVVLQITCPHDDLGSLALLTLGEWGAYIPQDVMYRICEGILAGRNRAIPAAAGTSDATEAGLPESPTT